MYTPAVGLTQVQIDRILSVKHNFQSVEAATGVPWQAVAGVWTRESFSVAAPKRPGGPFQFDPPLNYHQIKALLKKFSNLPDDKIEAFSKKGVDDFLVGAHCCACWLRLKCKPVLTPKSPDVHIKDAMYGYNGRAYGSADRSPYVMNGYDKNHVDMRIVGTLLNSDGSRKPVNVVDKRPGSFTVYKQLKELK